MKKYEYTQEYQITKKQTKIIRNINLVSIVYYSPPPQWATSSRSEFDEKLYTIEKLMKKKVFLQDNSLFLKSQRYNAVCCTDCT